MNEVFDVAIIGGGPAGSSAGTLLAKAGRRVVVFEQEKFPRFSVGESTLPATLNTLERMGVTEKIDQGGFLIKHGGEIVSACGKRVRFYFRNGFKSKRPTAYQVLRSNSTGLPPGTPKSLWKCFYSRKRFSNWCRRSTRCSQVMKYAISESVGGFAFLTY